MRGNVSKSTVSIDGPEAEIVFREGSVYARNGAGESQLLSNAPSYTTVFIRGGADNWKPETVYDESGNPVGTKYVQAVTVEKATITPNSRVDLFADGGQTAIFREKDVTIWAENVDGEVFVCCVGSVPQNDYSIKASVVEVAR